MLTVIVILLLLVLGYSISRLLKARKELSDQSSSFRKQQQTIRELNIINELTSSLLSSLEMESVIEMLLDRSKELLKATRSAIILLDENGEIQDFFTSMGPAPGCKIKLTGLLRKVYTDMTPARGDDITSLPGFEGFPEQHPDIGNVIIIPIILRGEVIGELIVTDKIKGERFTSDDEDLLLTIAFHSAFAIEKVILHNEILKMASTDGLTGLSNHKTFQERLENEIERVKRYDRPFSLLMLDIDYFKDFNDAFGHQTGDEALKAISVIMTENIRSVDMAARYGGEEFAIILSETPLEGALQTSERIRYEIENHKLEANGEEENITVSIGVATFPEDGSTREELIEAADKALYFSKRSGRNKVCTYR